MQTHPGPVHTALVSASTCNFAPADLADLVFIVYSMSSGSYALSTFSSMGVHELLRGGI